MSDKAGQLDVKALNDRVTAAEDKVKALETEKAQWVSSATAGNRSDSDESKCLRYFGVSHPRQLLSLNVGAERYAKVPEHIKHLALEFKRSVDTARWTSQMFHGAPLDRSGKKETDESLSNVKGMLDHHYGKQVLAPFIKAFGSTVVGGGDEWVPTALASSFIEEYELEKVLESRVRNVPMPTNPYEIPSAKDGTTARKVAEGATMTGSNFTTEKLTFSAVKLGEYYVLPEELTEDSAPDFMAAGRLEVMKAQKRAIEVALISGATGVHIDSDTAGGPADLAEKIWMGWRAQALANSAVLSFANGTVTETLLRQLRSRMGQFGANPKELMWVCGSIVYTQMLGLANVSTVDKFGPQATVLQGALAAYAGIPIVVSDKFREDLNATGVYDGITMDKAGILLVNHTRFYLGRRRPVQIKLAQSQPDTDVWQLASYQRAAFTGHAQSATEKSVVYGYHINTLA